MHSLKEYMYCKLMMRLEALKIKINETFILLDFTIYNIVRVYGRGMVEVLGTDGDGVEIMNKIKFILNRI